MADTNTGFQHDPEEPKAKAQKTWLPFSLCKKHGIAIQDWWTPRDAWNALKKNGQVEDVSEEYAAFYSRVKKAQAKKRRKELKDLETRAERKKEQLANPEHNPDKNYQHRDGYIAGAAKGAPMTHEQADSGHCNPYYDKGLIGYKTNCQTCVAVYIARRKGYNVRALPNLNNKSIYDLSKEPLDAYVNSEGYSPLKQHCFAPRRNPRTFLNEKVKEDRIYAVVCDWSDRKSGHIITAERRNGKVVMYDPQTNEQYTGNNISRFFRNAWNVVLADLTDYDMREDYCDNIMKGGK